MKQSKILKALSYIILPILIGTLILAFVGMSLEKSVYYNKEKYFASEMFTEGYISKLISLSNELIFRNTNYNGIIDGEKEIFYTDPYNVGYVNAKNDYYLVMYKNKAITNVELTASTKTIESIKTYIKSNPNAKTVDIINGEIESTSEKIQDTGIKYLNGFEITYYTKNNDNSINYITTKLEDFEIYSSYLEEFDNETEQLAMTKLRDILIKNQEYSYINIPISSLLIMLIIIYLIISIGYKKGQDGVVLNDFDKIPLEIIIFVAITIGCIPFVGLNSISELSEDYEAVISLLVTSFLMVYTLSAICLHTIIKRIKAKSFLKTTIIGKIIILIAKLLKKFDKKIKEFKKVLTYSASTTSKVIFYFSSFVFIAVFIVLLFRDTVMVFLLELLLFGFAGYKIIKILKEFSQIENKLKEMYEGNNQNKLNESEFSTTFQNTVKYVNDISNGLENAIQDRTKSERLKAELITNVSHDIKTPLTSIINYVDLLKQENIENEKANEYIGILDSKSQRLKKLTEDLIEASKVSTGNISLKLEKINIVELINQAIGEFEDKFTSKGLQIYFDTKENIVEIMADSRYMYRVIENLFSNISKYALENSRVYIDIRKFDKQVYIEMKNISKDKLNISADELMQRFVRGDKSRNTEGSGLGISIAQNLTELQNGKFDLRLDGDLFKVELRFDII